MKTARCKTAAPFKQMVRRFDLNERYIQVITRWYKGKPRVAGALQDPENPGVWMTQEIVCLETYEEFKPLR